jgi:hypothetical protein
MAIDLSAENAISVHEAARLIPSWRRGRPTHHSRVIRMILRGDLEALRIGGQWVTSREAIERMGERLAAREVSGAAPSPAPTNTAPVRSPAARRRAIEQAERQLAELGV